MADTLREVAVIAIKIKEYVERAKRHKERLQIIQGQIDIIIAVLKAFKDDVTLRLHHAVALYLQQLRDVLKRIQKVAVARKCAKRNVVVSMLTGLEKKLIWVHEDFKSVTSLAGTLNLMELHQSEYVRKVQSAVVSLPEPVAQATDDIAERAETAERAPIDIDDAWEAESDDSDEDWGVPAPRASGAERTPGDLDLPAERTPGDLDLPAEVRGARGVAALLLVLQQEQSRGNMARMK